MCRRKLNWDFARLSLLAAITLSSVVAANAAPKSQQNIKLAANHVDSEEELQKLHVKDQSEQLIGKLQEHVRQGDERQVESVINQLAILTEGNRNKDVLSKAVDFLIGRKRWNLAKSFLEQMPECEPGWGYLLVNHWLEEAGKDQQKISEIDLWIKKRLPANPSYWARQRFLIAQKTNTESRFFQSLESEIKQDPDRKMKELCLYLELATQSKRDISWVAQDIHPKLALDNYLIAESLHGHAKEAIVFLERARDIKQSEADKKAIKDYMLKYTARVANKIDDPSRVFNFWVLNALAVAYQQAGESSQAQAILLKLSKEQGGSYPVFALSQFAGNVQSQTTAHPLEQQIKEAEPENKNSIDYWQGRASYYSGRKDFSKQKEALDKALQLSEAGSDTDQTKSFQRSIVVSDYARFLRVRDGEAAALNFLWNEFDRTKSADLRSRILREISQQFERDDTHYIMPTDERLWRFLGETPTWDSLEERLVLRMARNAPSPDALSSFWQKAGKMASGNGSRELIVGWVMSRCGDPKRSIPILQSALKHVAADQVNHTAFTLYESYQDSGDWRSAEKLWPQASKQLTTEEKPNWMARLAITAARSGDKIDALRLWRKKDESDPSSLGHLPELAKLGMKTELTDYYRTMAKEKPGSTVPKEALLMLERG